MSEYETSNHNKLSNLNILNSIGILLGSLFSVVLFLNNVYSYFYSAFAEKFYGIPKKYFYNNVIGDFGVAVISLLVYFLILLYPFLVKSYYLRLDFLSLIKFVFQLVLHLLMYRYL